MDREGKSLNDLRNEEEIKRLIMEDYPVDYVKYRFLYAQYNSDLASSLKHLSQEEEEELKAFRKQRAEIEMPQGYSEGFYEKFWADYELYNQQNRTRVSPAEYWTTIGTQYGLNYMFLAQAMDTDIIDEIAREQLFIQTFPANSNK